MPRLVTKFKYMKPGVRGKPAGGYARYIATREGVEKIDDSRRHAPATQKQQTLIAKLLRDFPEAKTSHEYQDYLANQTVGNASEFITQVIEENMDAVADTKTYADYIATRPRAERFGSHGLFTDDGVQVQLEKVSAELNQYTGHMYTSILSLRREDAIRLGFDTGNRWRDFLRSQTQTLAENLKIPLEHLRWYAAYHNEGHHPHVHLIAYSSVPGEGYLSEQGVERIRSAFARDIFFQDLLCTYEQQTTYRDQLRQQGGERVAEIVEQINVGEYHNEKVEDLLRKLSDRLAHTSGKKQYGYLKSDLKAMVDQVVMELAKDEMIQRLYDLWYDQREDVLRTYTDTFPERIPLEQNKEFRSIRNAVIQEAMKITEQIRQVASEEPYQDVPEIGLPKGEEPMDGSQIDPQYWRSRIPPVSKGNPVSEEGQNAPKEESVDDRLLYRLAAMCLSGNAAGVDFEQERRYFEAAAEQGNADAMYGLGKLYLKKEYSRFDPIRAIEYLEQSAEKDHAFAKYQLGKLLCEGTICDKDIARGLTLLEELGEKGISVASYLAGKVYLREKDRQDIKKAISHFKAAAEDGNSYAEYQLGKIYYFGTGVRPDAEKGLDYLKASADHGNAYAAELLRSIQYQQTRGVVMAANSLLAQLGRLFQENQQKQEQSQRIRTDRKYRRQIDEKKQALGIRD